MISLWAVAYLYLGFIFTFNLCSIALKFSTQYIQSVLFMVQSRNLDMNRYVFYAYIKFFGLKFLYSEWH